VRELEERLKDDGLRQPGEHWYELIEHFDAHAIQRLPVKQGRAFIMGQLNSMTVVEVSRDMGQEALAKLGQWLEDNGIEALIVTEGIRFLKIGTVAPEIETQLDAAPTAPAEEEDGQETDAAARA
jgi:hypothetical protein